MKGNTKVIERLNAQLTKELTSVDQYVLQAAMFDDWGHRKLHARLAHEADDEREHARRLIERILFLEGLPNLQDYGKLMIGENTREMLECDLKLEHKAHTDLKDAIAHCEQVRDYTSRDLFQKILDDEEEHIDHLETELGLIDAVGIQNYLQKQMHTA